MNRRSLLYALGLIAALLIGRWTGGATPAPMLLSGPAAAWADEIHAVPDGATFVSTEEGSAYLWRREGDRLVLVNQCLRVQEGGAGQASFVSLPGVERGS